MNNRKSKAAKTVIFTLFLSFMLEDGIELDTRDIYSNNQYNDIIKQKVLRASSRKINYIIFAHY
jgi:hypothetical protein